MEGIVAYYLRLFEHTDMQYNWFGVSITHAALSILTMLFMMALAVLILKARPKSSENRFMSLMLAVEGLKAIVSWYAIYPPFGPDILPMVQAWRVIFYTLAILSVLMYLSMSAFYPVRFLGFMTKDRVKENLYWVLPLISIGIITFLITSNGGLENTFGEAIHVDCKEGAEYADVTKTDGSEILDSECFKEEGATPYSWITSSQTGLGRLLLFLPVLTAFMALAFMRNAQKRLEENIDEVDDSELKASEARAIKVGFTGKTLFQGSMFIFMIFITAKFGQFDLNDMLLVGLNPDLKYYMYGLYGFLFSMLFASLFEGIMFSYAILKNEVLGIDETLRKTFSTTVFATLGAILLLVATEAMEASLDGFGWLGGVVIGVPLIVLRKPIMGTINGFSSRLMPEAFTSAEKQYLEAYDIAMSEGNVSSEARKLLKLQAKTLKLSESRIQHLEDWYNRDSDSEEE